MCMHPYISHEIARARQRDLLEGASRQRLASRLRPASPIPLLFGTSALLRQENQCRKPIRFAVAQVTVHGDPRDVAALRGSGQQIRRLMRDAHQAGARLVHFPEGATNWRRPWPWPVNCGCGRSWVQSIA